MRADAPGWTDLYLSLAAIVGLVVLQGVILARGPEDPLNRRFLFGLRVTMLLFAGRALVSLTGLQGLRTLTLLAAALIPISVLILTEGLLRRHAPAWIKSLIGGGTALFAVLAVLPSAWVEPFRSYGFLLFQVSGLLVSGWLVLGRDARSLSASENRTVERLGLSLLLLIPLVAADYLMVWLGLPIQLSALAVLLLCWLAISLGRIEAGHGGVLGGFAVIVLVTVLAAAVIAQLATMDKDGAILVGAIVLAALLVAAIISDARALKSEEQSLSLLRHMADFDHADALGFLRGLADHPLVQGAVLVDAAALADLNEAVLARLFAVNPVLRRTYTVASGDDADHLAHLFDRFAATHLLFADDAPFRLVALSMPALATSPRAELELRAVQRMAWLIAKGGAHATV